PEENVMNRNPRNPRDGIFGRGQGYKKMSRGLLIVLDTLIAFIASYQYDLSHLTYGKTIAFSTLCMSLLIHVFYCRYDHSVFYRYPFQNVYLVLAVISLLLLFCVVIYWEPLQPIFHTTYLGLHDCMLIIGLSALPTVLFGFTKK